jgi:hypothetical protein
MRSALRPGSWRTASYLALAAALSGCGAPDESLSSAAQGLDSFIFKQRQEPLFPREGKANDEFGLAIGISSRWAAIGSPNADFRLEGAPEADVDDDSGAATLFERKQGNFWEEALTLRAGSWPLAHFGSSVATTNQVVVLGAADADPVGDGSWGAGLVASFTYASGSWDPVPQLLHDPEESPERFALFGAALAADDHTLLVGAPGADQVFSYARTPSGWSNPVPINLPIAASSLAFFGFAVALEEPFAFVGAPWRDGEGEPESDDRGAVYVFKHSGSEWVPQGELEPNVLKTGDLFGASVAVRNGLAVATAYGDASLVIFPPDNASGWGAPVRVAAAHITATSAFGSSLALGSRDTVWVGAWRDDDFDGTAFPFLRDGDAWRESDGLTFSGGGRFGYSIASASGALMVGAPDAAGENGAVNAGAVYVIETSDGSTCTEDADCFSTHCVAGVCCDSACDQPCYSCFSSEKASKSADGTCEPKRQRAPDEACSDDGSRSCGTNGLCDGQGQCAKYAPGTQCGDPFCSEDQLVGAAVCDGNGACEPPKPESCKSYACRNGSCQDTCEADADCSETNYCDDGRCQPKHGLGEICSSASACSEGHCADGVCCDKACDGQCEACAELGSEGSCVPLAPGTPPRVGLAAMSKTEVCARLFCDGEERSSASMPASASEVCTPAGCVDGVEVGEGRCDGQGSCRAPVVKACGPYACGAADADKGRPGQCSTRCESVADCAPDFYCTTENECRPIEAIKPESRGCSTTPSAGGIDRSCFELVTWAIALLGLRRRKPATREYARHQYHSLG